MTRTSLEKLDSFVYELFSLTRSKQLESDAMTRFILSMIANYLSILHVGIEQEMEFKKDAPS